MIAVTIAIGDVAIIVTPAISVIPAIIVTCVIRIVGSDARAAIPPAIPIRASVIRMAIIAAVINIQAVCVPADRES